MPVGNTLGVQVHNDKKHHSVLDTESNHENVIHNERKHHPQ